MQKLQATLRRRVDHIRFPMVRRIEFQGKMATSRDADLLAQDAAELDGDDFQNGELDVFTGSVRGEGGLSGWRYSEPVAEIDYGPNSETALSKPWSEPTANLLVDLKAAMTAVAGPSGYYCNLSVMGKRYNRKLWTEEIKKGASFQSEKETRLPHSRTPKKKGCTSARE
jgi:hypothetical protein